MQVELAGALIGLVLMHGVVLAMVEKERGHCTTMVSCTMWDDMVLSTINEVIVALHSPVHRVAPTLHVWYLHLSWVTGVTW